MRKSTSGFTIVELLVVIAVIIILTAIGAASYIGIQNSANADTANAFAKQLAAGAERYYVQNGEYPIPPSFPVTPSTCSTFSGTDASSAATVFNLPEEDFIDETLRPLLCFNASGTYSDETKMYYFSRQLAGDSTQRTFTFGSPTTCTITIPSTASSNETGGSAYAIVYKDVYLNQWKALRSTKGIITISSGCSFS